MVELRVNLSLTSLTTKLLCFYVASRLQSFSCCFTQRRSAFLFDSVIR
jgi:hypothetical protein